MSFTSMFNGTMDWFKSNPETSKLFGGVAVGVGSYMAQSALQDRKYSQDVDLEKLRQKNRLEFSDHQQNVKDKRTGWATDIDTRFDANIGGEKGALTGGGLLARLKTRG
ncbi:hypothetical protein [Vibrio sp. 99-8-1]|uniref:hypothetical protein n=1 Tax=Vibrio sp. 99-8-1 TaxID=2607602 RepID=UPI00149364D6|nr:hypothetical protein [Vibrio sp. 99-8-1]NOI66930.1 hypothetical protein [Vibrio sp. 99-8-1]